ncbi:MAG TPA: cupredoxin domain-containing protein [Symbiobacteriaceae bacterium]|nr:cupredoxin domain-containing protein [Symbiobacteriaceae bacterium]
MMGQFARRGPRLLPGVMLVALALAGCSGSAGSADSIAGSVAGSVGELVKLNTTDNSPDAVIIINVDVTEDAIQPSSINIPAGRRVELVLRNRGTTEHHFIVDGLAPKDPLWLIRAESATVSGGSDQDAAHNAHHQNGVTEVEYVPFRLASPSGIKPNGHQVHGYAIGGAMDVVIFTATNTGSFKVTCPLHPGVTGTVTVS